ncbi:MAG: right-handed parallel beta-helix repeat-containing protein [bacterium]
MKIFKSSSSIFLSLILLGLAFSSFLPVAVEAATLTVPTTYPTISAALTAATAGDVIDIAAGTYSENIIINKSVTLRGPNFGINPNSGADLSIVNPSRVAGAILTPVSGAAIAITPGTNNVVIDGLDFKNFVGNALSFKEANDLQFLNNNISNVTLGINGGGIIDSCCTVAPNASNLSIKNNRLQNPVAITGVSAMQLKQTNNLMVSDNFISKFDRGIQLDNNNTATVSGNTIEDINLQGIQLAFVISDTTITKNIIRRANINKEYQTGAIRLYGSKFSGAINIVDNILDNSYNGIATVAFLNDLSNKNITISKNTISNNINIGIRHHGDGAFLPLTKNIFIGNGLDIDHESGLINPVNLIAVGVGFDNLNGNTYSVTNQNDINAVEKKIRHNCQTSTFIHGVCNDATNETTLTFRDLPVILKYASVQYALNASVVPPSITLSNTGDSLLTLPLIGILLLGAGGVGFFTLRKGFGKLNS